MDKTLCNLFALEGLAQQAVGDQRDREGQQQQQQYSRTGPGLLYDVDNCLNFATCKGNGANEGIVVTLDVIIYNVLGHEFSVDFLPEDD